MHLCELLSTCWSCCETSQRWWRCYQSEVITRTNAAVSWRTWKNLTQTVFPSFPVLSIRTDYHISRVPWIPRDKSDWGHFSLFKQNITKTDMRANSTHFTTEYLSISICIHSIYQSQYVYIQSINLNMYTFNLWISICIHSIQESQYVYIKSMNHNMYTFNLWILICIHWINKQTKAKWLGKKGLCFIINRLNGYPAHSCIKYSLDVSISKQHQDL